MRLRGCAQNAREPLLVVSELLYTMLNLRLKYPGRNLVAAAHCQAFPPRDMWS